jgi:hypothetical protein
MRLQSALCGRWLALACLLLAAPAGAEPDPSADSGGYPSQPREAGTPTSIDRDLDTSFPKQDSVIPQLMPQHLPEFKKKLYEDYGLKLAVGYQTLIQYASDTLTGNDVAVGGWLQVESKWTPLRRGKDYEGSLVVVGDGRWTLGDNSNPGEFGQLDVGSVYGTNLEFFLWDFSLVNFYWEQWFDKDRFVLRLGKQIAGQTYDFFRFKDARTSFTAAPFSLHESIPAPGPGQGVSFEWWPREGSELYFVGTLNDMNGSAERMGFDTFFQKAQFFYGLEVGYFWRRSRGDFDHVHFDLFYADEKDTQTPGLPNEAGWGLKLLGSKQWGRIVGFGSYTYNTAEGGGVAATLGRHTVTAGGAYLKPLGIRGELGLGFVWMQPGPNPLLGTPDPRDQYGLETYWKILLTPDLWITPGVQFIFNPSRNFSTDFVAMPQFKFRVFF